MPARRYVEENGLAAMVAAKWSAGVVPEVNLREHKTQTALPSVNKAAHFGFEIQRQHHQKCKTGILDPTKRSHVHHKFKKNKNKFM